MTVIITISIIALILILGQVLEALLEPFYDKRTWIKRLMNVYPTPFNIMRLYARVGDTEGFTRTHAMTGFAFFAIMAVVGFFAWWADQQVLYGLEYVASRDKNSAYIQSVGIATIIQAMLIFNGGMAVKIWINGLRSNKDHEIQFRINLLLFLIAFASTLSLSFMTYYVAKAKGIEAEKIVKGEIHGEHDAQLNAFDVEIKRWERMLKRDSTAVQTAFLQSIETIEKQTGSYRTLKDAQQKQGTFTKEHAAARVSSMDIWGSTETRKVATKRDKEMAEILAKYNPHIEQLQKQRSEAVVNTVKKKTSAEDGLTLDIATNAEATMGKNLILNIIAFFFNLGLQFFVRGANKENPKKTQQAAKENDEDNDTEEIVEEHPKPKRKPFKTANSNLNDLNKDLDEIEELEAIPIDDVETKIKKRQQENKSGGGSLEINREIQHKILPNGDVVILYKGINRDEWWTWRQFMYAVKNRINKFDKVVSREAKDNQLEWIRLFESRMDFIENMTTGKTLPKRVPFDPNNPTKKIFGV